MKVQILSVIAVLALTACSQDGAPPRPVDSDHSAVAATSSVAAASTVATSIAPAVVTEPATLGDNIFSVTSPSFRSCDAVDGAITVTAKWDVTTLGAPEVAIYVEGPDSSRKLWLNGGATGESTTGNWVFNHSRFDVMKRGTDEKLATLEVNLAPCK